MYSAVGIVFSCYALLQKEQAVVPAPDGGYPNFNTAEGQNALLSLTTGLANTAIGWSCLLTDSTGSFNTAVGAGALDRNNSNENTAVGTGALLLNATGGANTAVGAFTLLNNTEAGGSTAIGNRALQNQTGTGFNTAVGYQALRTVTTGSNNTALGASAGIQIDTESGNVCVGAGVSTSLGENNFTRIRNIGTTPIGAGINVVIANTGGLGDGALGYPSSSRRYKEEIKPVDKASEKLFALQPVSFRTKVNTGAANVKLYGLIAEDVAMVDPDLVVFNADGQPETLRFDSINAMLLNEFLKEHRKVQEQDATIAQLNQGMQVLTAQLKAQAEQIQKVSARLELHKFATGRIRDGGPAQQVIARGR
jgi:hypothetical protein